MNKKDYKQIGNLSEWDKDSMWMSYRYCIGRHTIASHQRAGDIAKHCYGKLNWEQSIFNAYDINREIEDKLRFGYPEFKFPITSLNRIYTSAIDILCRFIVDYNIKSKEDFIQYHDVEIVLDNTKEGGYSLYATTWDEWSKEKLEKYSQNCDSEEWAYYKKELARKPKADTFWMHDIEDLFVWNDLVHLFDLEHHHKSILVDGSECEWFWTWTENTELHDDGYYYKAFGYQKIRVPVDKWYGNITVRIPDSSIKKDLW